MKLTTIEKYLKLIIIGFAVCGILVYVIFLPEVGRSLAAAYPEFAHWYTPWLVFLWMTVIPCYLVLLEAWKVAVNIGADRSFSYENGKAFKRISFYAGGDAVFFFTGNLVLWIAGYNHPGIMAAAMILVFFGFAIALASKALAQLVDNAAELQEESEWTI